MIRKYVGEALSSDLKKKCFQELYNDKSEVHKIINQVHELM